MSYHPFKSTTALAALLLAGLAASPVYARSYNNPPSDSWESLGTFEFYDGMNTGTRYNATLELNRDNTDLIRIPDAWSAAGCTAPFLLDIARPYCVVIPEQEGARSVYYNSDTHLCSMSYYSIFLGGATVEEFVEELPIYNIQITNAGIDIKEWAIVARFLINDDPMAWGYANDPMTIPLPEAYYALDFEAGGIRYHIHSLNDNTVLVNGADEAAAVTIPATVDHDGKQYSVVGINHRAFYKNTVLESIVLPDGISSIGDNAFTGCSNLSAINLPDGVELGEDVFSGCAKLTDATEGGLVYRLNFNRESPACDLVDYDAASLPASAEILANVTVGGSQYPVTAITEYAMVGAPMASLKIPASVNSIAYNAFGNNANLARFEVDDASADFAATADGWLTDKAGTSLLRVPDAAGESVAIPQGITKLATGCLYRNTGVRSISIPESVTEIGTLSLVETALTSLTVPGTVKTIAERAITENPEIEEITFAEGVEAILSNNLNNNGKLRKINIPASLYNWKIQLAHNVALEEIKVAEGNPVVCDVDGVLFSANKSDLIRFPSSKATEYVIPDGTRRLVAMDYSLLQKVTIPATVAQIDPYCFSYPMALNGAGERTYTHMAEINVHNPVPVPFEYSVFYTNENNRTFLTYTKAILNVPVGSKAAYSSFDTTWGNFDNIYEKEFDSVEAAVAVTPAKVRCAGGIISVVGDCGILRVISLSGSVIYSGPAADVAVTPGAIYIVEVDGRTIKLIAK